MAEDRVIPRDGAIDGARIRIEQKLAGVAATALGGLPGAVNAVAVAVAGADPARYESLPENESQGFYYLIKNVSILVAPGVAPFTGDVGISASRRVRTVQGQRRLMHRITLEGVPLS